MSYSDLLRDPRWQRKRLEVMNAADWKCVACGETTKTLNVHHTRYERGRMPWEYDNSELRCICEDCHARCEPTGGEVPPVRSRRDIERQRTAKLAGSAEREILRVLVHRSDFLTEVAEKVGPDSFYNEQHRELFSGLLEGDGTRTLADTLLFLSPDTFTFAMELMSDATALDHADEIVSGGLSVMHERNLHARMAAIDTAMPTATDDEKDALTREKMALTGEVRRLGGHWWRKFR